MNNLFWLLLPIAAASGWFLASRKRDGKAGNGSGNGMAPDYFKGLNYVLNEQPDKAIEIFIKLLEVDSSTLETHFTLGNLYRKRGEVDRAIRIHQNIIARPALGKPDRELALLELGQDYLKAGLLDRAEALFLELVDAGAHVEQSYKNLIDIYQLENDWDRAIETARKLESTGDENYDQLVAQFYCEQAEKLAADDRSDDALAVVRQALATSPGCVRASILEGRLALERGDPGASIIAYKRVEQQNPVYLPEVVVPLLDCYGQKGDMNEMVGYLEDVLERYGGITPMLVLSALIRERDGDDDCIQFITTQLRKRPSVRGLDRLIDITMAHADGDARDNLSILKDMTSKLLENRAVYKCNHCGFVGRSLHWQCPGCKRWTTVEPIQGVEGE